MKKQSNLKSEKFVATIIGMELCPELLNWKKRFRESPSKAGFSFYEHLTTATHVILSEAKDLNDANKSIDSSHRS
jgi:hypothetical protein